MAGPGLTIVRRIRSMLGSRAAVDTDRTGLPRVAPANEEGVALVLRTAAEEGWKVRLEGLGGWVTDEAPADLAVTTRALARITHLNPADLVVTVEAGTPFSELRAGLAEHGTWVSIDPPGDERSVGSVVATATAGPLRAGLGPVRDQVLGLTIVTGDGRLIRPGGRVVKNVAGFDLTKLAVGSFGAFGVITSVTLRVRAVPRADVTLVGTGARDNLLHAARKILDAGLTPAALEVVSPAGHERDWTLAVRLAGPQPAADADRTGVLGIVDRAARVLTSAEASAWWQRHAANVTQAGAVTLRLGTLPTALDDALDLAAHHLPDGLVSVTVGAGAIRWSGTVPADRVKLLRHAAAQREIPLTLERAPWALRQELGHFGAYREGVGRLVQALQRTFDPEGVLVTGVGADG